ncbi:MAG: ribonuclease III [Chloroflexota bacterium]|nr:MAG: ribonuclease III [Chloroflexota bacterium]
MTDLSSLQSALGIEFDDIRILQQSLVHRSYINENPDYPLASNERLEFLGDAVLGFLVAEYLYRSFPELSEGQLTQLRSSVVRMESLARIARGLNLGEYLYLGKGEESSGGRQRQLILADSLEAVIGAVFLDAGLSVTGELVLRLVQQEIDNAIAQKISKDFKSRLQEVAQRRWQLTPVYRTIAALGPDHAKQFVVEAIVGENALGKGTGRNKQAAEQEAARLALQSLGEEV